MVDRYLTFYIHRRSCDKNCMGQSTFADLYVRLLCSVHIRGVLSHKKSKNRMRYFRLAFSALLFFDFDYLFIYLFSFV